ncbi:heavy metal-associated isoprenylated plant protein 39-like [Silene latifolia]|uniref:heavy metal-associated isoprenylated plant protein 39-like n=1 Tax=Silene latifolia TaxID=37657 RepID=UPI003D77570A
MKMTVVLKLDMHDNDKCKRKVMKIVSPTPGIESISVDTKQRKLTLTGNMDPVTIVNKLRKVYHTEVDSIGPVKQPEKKKDEPKSQAQIVEYIPFEFYSNNNFPTYPVYYSYPYYFRH